MKEKELIPHLFRTEYSKITAVLSKLLGMQNIAAAEDIASETFLSAVELWPYEGVPANPPAWLFKVAKNKAKNYISRNNIFHLKVSKELKNLDPQIIDFEIDWSEKNISDSQLQTLFALCHPSISAEAQIGLALRILCGFGIEEIANAFLTNKETINKRLTRAREKLRQEKVEIKFLSPKEINSRISQVLTIMYLLFNEGYYSESKDSVVRKELCLEAMRLMYLLSKNEPTNLPETNALLSLMCFHSSRFGARNNNKGEMILYADQDEDLWDKELISKGSFYLIKAAESNKISKYYLEASIAYWHTIKANTQEKWDNILMLYNLLLQVEYTPIAALNRTYALSMSKGKEKAIIEAEKLNLQGNHYFFTLLGALYTGIDKVQAKINFEHAIHLAKSQKDKHLIQQKIDCL